MSLWKRLVRRLICLANLHKNLELQASLLKKLQFLV